MTNKTIAVTGATGQQGGAVARRLLAEGWQVRALTRDTHKAQALALADLGATLMPGDMDNRAELDAAFQGVEAVFSVQNYWLPNVGFEGEVRQGQQVIDAAKAAGVQHFIYSSVGAAHRGAGQRHFDSKYLIEQHLQASGLAQTILRPVFFMENFNFPWTRPYVLNGTLPSLGLRPEKRMQLVAVADIAAFAALALSQPEQYLGQTVELAGDEQTETEIAATFSKVLGRTVTLAAPQGNGQPPSEEMLAMNRFFNGEAYTADIPALRQAYPGLLKLETYLRQNGWENAAAVPLPENQAA
jgi:uncharacterized protein YbjT (DUF2867 family)